MRHNIKRIFVPLDPTVYAQAAAESACKIAREHNSQVSGVAVLDSHEIRSSLVPTIGPYYPGMIDEVRKKIHHADEILRDCLDRFAKTCEEMGVAHLETEYEGIPVQKFLESAIFYDLIVVGMKTCFHFETRKDIFQPVDKLLDRTVSPILIVPATGLEKPEKVLITVDGSMGSSRALHDFVRYATPYTFESKLVCAEKEPHESDFLLSNAAEYLRAHGIEEITTEAIEGPIQDAVDGGAANGVNLIVAGIHSKKRIKDQFVGSFTKYLVKRADISLFLSH